MARPSSDGLSCPDLWELREKPELFGWDFENVGVGLPVDRFKRRHCIARLPDVYPIARRDVSGHVVLLRMRTVGV